VSPGDGSEVFVDSAARRIRCLAGPGTGKTRALQRRVERLLADEHVPGSRIFAVTFTRLAASQLGAALQQLGVPGSEDVRASTLHSFAFSLLNDERAIAASGRTARPCLEFELNPLYHDIGAQFGGVGRARQLGLALDAMWARAQAEAPGVARTPEDLRFEEEFTSWMRFHKAMAIGELVPLAVNFLTANPVNAAQAAFDEVIVDEYQDLNRADQRLVELVGGPATLAIIGDDDQSIYGFRYAHPEGIRDWVSAQPFPADDASLTTCHRSDGILVEVSNALIRRNPGRVRGDLRPESGREAAGELSLVQWPTREAETQGIANGITSIVAGGRLPAGESLIVIVPRHQFGAGLVQKLTALGTGPVKLHSPPDWKSPELRKSITLFNLINRPEDGVALRTWLGLDRADWRKAEYARLRRLSEVSGRSPSEILADPEGCKIAKIASLHHRWAELQREQAELGQLPRDDLIARLFPPGGPLGPVGLRLRALQSNRPSQPGPDQLANALLGPEEDSVIPGVNIMTYFGAKGLSCHTVVVTALVNGLLPGKPNPGNEEEQRKLEEERRLLYVALTRAKCRIVLSSFRNASRRENAQLNLGLSGGGYRLVTQASLFLSELGPTCPPTMTGESWLRNLR
jgi:DNA helicase-2/ATP-dependent DNA helicase PcrA